jgi:hypothetical protein
MYIGYSSILGARLLCRLVRCSNENSMSFRAAAALTSLWFVIYGSVLGMRALRATIQIIQIVLRKSLDYQDFRDFCR